jgi:hypothetical protein
MRLGLASRSLARPVGQLALGRKRTRQWREMDSNSQSRSRKQGTFWSWLQNLRSYRAQPAEAPPVSSALTSHEPGDFLIESLLRILHINRGINALLAVRHGPAHPSLGKEYGQPESRPVVLEAAVASQDPPNDAIADQRFHLYVIRSRWPRALTRSTQNPFSSL